MLLNFKIEITCSKCGSKTIETELLMNQGLGLLAINCLDCDNKPKKYNYFLFKNDIKIKKQKKG